MAQEKAESPFYEQLEQLLLSTQRKMESTTHKYAPLKEDTINSIEGSFYSNLIRLFQKNLNEKFFDAVNMDAADRRELEYLLEPFFEKARETSEEVYNKGEVDFHLYQDFRRTIYDFGDDAYWLLLGVENYAEIIRCEHRIIKFKNYILSL